MSVYNKGGVQQYALYDVNGTLVDNAYDVNGDVVYSKNTLRVMNYNVGGWYCGSGTNVPSTDDAKFYALQNGILERNKADILCIEEYWTNFSQSGRTAASVLSPYFDYIHPEAGNEQYYGRCICSKHEITSYSTHYFTNDNTGKRYYDEAVININGTSVSVFVTHLHPSDIPKRILQAGEIYTYVSALSRPYIICGDFNSPLHDPFSEQNANIYNQFLNADDTLANGGAFGILNTACNSQDWSNAFAIDQIICSDDFQIKSVSTDLTKTTANLGVNIDHIPLIGNIAFA